ncbi:TetR/AcrR family transcriptional regulator, partial [Liquorilactobacillus sp.]
ELMNAIFHSTIEILNNEGYSNLTFSRVAILAGTTRAVLYRRWENPFMMLYDAEQHFSDDISSFSNIDFSNSSMRANLVRAIGHFHSSPKFIRAYMTELGNDMPYAKNLASKIKKDNLFIMGRLLKQAQLDGEIKKNVSDYVKLLPFNLLMYQAMLNPDELTHAWVKQMIDETVIPAIMAQQKQPKKE